MLTLNSKEAEERVSMLLLRTLAQSIDASNKMTLDNSKVLGKVLDSVSNLVMREDRTDNLKSELDRIEKWAHDLQLEINLLKSEQDKRTGMVMLVEWLGKNTPWLLALVAAVYAALNLKKGS